MLNFITLQVILGGAKAIMPGVSSYAAIQANHSNMIRDGAHAGNIETNPLRNDIDEVGEHFKLTLYLMFAIFR